MSATAATTVALAGNPSPTWAALLWEGSSGGEGSDIINAHISHTRVNASTSTHSKHRTKPAIISTMIIRNRTAKRDYELLDTYEAGIVLAGHEVKAIRTQGVKLEGAYVKIIGGEVQLVNAHIPRYRPAGKDEEYDPARTRKLLLNKKEILEIQSKMEQKGDTTLVPVSIYSKGKKLKAQIAIAKGRKSWQKKKIDARKTEKRQAEKEMKEYMKK